MSDVTVTHDVAASVETTWAVLRDFGDIGWIPVAGQVDVEGDGPGMTRTIHGSGDNDPVIEQLTGLDDGARTITYAIDGKSPLPVQDYTGTVTISDGPDGAIIRWSATFEPVGDEAEATAVVELMLTTLAGWLGDAAASAG